MTGIETLALLTAHGASTIGGRGGIDRTTAQDVAAALGMARLGEGAERLSLAYATREPQHVRAWRTWWLRGVQAAAERRAWDEPHHRVMRFGLMTYVDSLGPTHCPRCNGTGVHKNQKTCAGCNGVGKVDPTPSWHADRMEIDRPTWLDRWQRRYDAAAALHATWLDSADVIRKHLRRTCS